ncbi:MAG: SDR family oxidoreductase [Anaerolineales bacterium]
MKRPEARDETRLPFTPDLWRTNTIMRILITGASGLLGLNLALETAANHEVYGTAKDHPLNTGAFKVLQSDLLAPGAVEKVLETAQPDWVIHCAALANVDACESDPVLARKSNSDLPAELAAYVARGGARLVHISTDAVFDGSRGGYTEQDTPNPLSVYAHTKLEGERFVAEANPQAIIARVNLFGWSISGSRSLGEFFVSNLQVGKKVMGFTDVMFCPLLATDLAAILVKMLERELSGLYHVVSRECLSKYEFGLQVARKFDLDESLINPVSVVQSGLLAARSPKLTLRTDKLARDLGEPPPDVDAGLGRFYHQYLEGYPERIRRMATGGRHDP